MNVRDEVQARLDRFEPDLLAVSVMTTNYQYCIDLMRELVIPCPVIFGGVHPTLCPKDVIAHSFVDIVCIGEGDEAVPELCQAMQERKDYSHISNLWIKKNGQIIKNPQRPFVDLNTLPVPDWSLFDERHLFRPFDGEIYTGGFYLTSRGCPGRCTYCVNEILQHISKDYGKYFRRMKPEKIYEQIKFLIDRYRVNWLRFGDDTFLLYPVSELREIKDLIKPLHIKFACSVRPDTVTQEKVHLLKEMGCVSVAVGIESGNEELRRTQLNRPISNKQIENALAWITGEGMRAVTFNLVGSPEETRENVFETIRLNKKLKVDAANVYIVYPFPGSILYKKYNVNILDENNRIIPMSKADVFNFSQMTHDEVVGLQKTFNLYLHLPEELWPIIRLAEDDTEQGKCIFTALKEFAASNL